MSRRRKTRRTVGEMNAARVALTATYEKMAKREGIELRIVDGKTPEAEFRIGLTYHQLSPLMATREALGLAPGDGVLQSLISTVFRSWHPSMGR